MLSNDVLVAYLIVGVWAQNALLTDNLPVTFFMLIVLSYDCYRFRVVNVSVNTFSPPLYRQFVLVVIYWPFAAGGHVCYSRLNYRI